MSIDVEHHCGRSHRCYQSLAECRWPDAAFVTGDGPWALVARCDMVSVALYESRDEVRRRRKRMDTVGCGRSCDGRHDVVDLAQVEAPAAR